MKARQFFYIASGILLVLLVGGGVVDYLANAAIHQKTQILQQRLATQSASLDQVNQLAALKTQYQKLLPVVPQIEAALPRTKDQSVIALQLQQLAQSAGLSLPSVSFTSPATLPNTTTSQTVPAGNVLALPVTFQLSGTYLQMQTFLRSLENLNRYTGVSNITISHKDDKLQLLNFTMTVNVYTKP